MRTAKVIKKELDFDLLTDLQIQMDEETVQTLSALLPEKVNNEQSSDNIDPVKLLDGLLFSQLIKREDIVLPFLSIKFHTNGNMYEWQIYQ